jgi:hypothetical protein
MLQNKYILDWKLLVMWGFGFNVGFLTRHVLLYLRPPAVVYKTFDIEESMVDELDEIIMAFENTTDEVTTDEVTTDEVTTKSEVTIEDEVLITIPLDFTALVDKLVALPPVHNRMVRN